MAKLYGASKLYFGSNKGSCEGRSRFSLLFYIRRKWLKKGFNEYKMPNNGQNDLKLGHNMYYVKIFVINSQNL